MLTGSELLSLEEEIEMQKKWATGSQFTFFTSIKVQMLTLEAVRAEYDKATFIVLHKESKQMVGDMHSTKRVRGQNKPLLALTKHLRALTNLSLCWH